MEELWVLVSVKYDEKLGHKVYVFDDPEDAILVQEFLSPLKKWNYIHIWKQELILALRLV